MANVRARLFRWYTEFRGRGEGYAELAERLRSSERATVERMAAVGDNRRNRAVANHIVGIERWGQRRLRILLGEPVVHDEYDAYAPGIDLPMAVMCERFRATRSETLAILRQLEQAGVELAATAPHNELGDLSLSAWLTYLADHSARESYQFLFPQWVPTSQTFE